MARNCEGPVEGEGDDLWQINALKRALKKNSYDTLEEEVELEKIRLDEREEGKVLTLEILEELDA